MQRDHLCQSNTIKTVAHLKTDQVRGGYEWTTVNVSNIDTQLHHREQSLVNIITKRIDDTIKYVKVMLVLSVKQIILIFVSTTFYWISRLDSQEIMKHFRIYLTFSSIQSENQWDYCNITLIHKLTTMNSFRVVRKFATAISSILDYFDWIKYIVPTYKYFKWINVVNIIWGKSVTA